MRGFKAGLAFALTTLLCTACPSPNAPYGTGYGAPSNPIASFISFLTGSSSGYPKITPGVPGGNYSVTNPETRGFPLSFEALWSPDGKRIALLAAANTTSLQPPRIYLIDAASGQIQADWAIYNPAVVIKDASDIEPHPLLSWGTDGSLLVMQQSGQPAAMERVFLHRLRPGAPVETEVIHLPLRFNDRNFLSYSHLSLSPDQQQLALYEHQPSDKKNAYGDKVQPMLYDIKTRTLRKLGQTIESNNSYVSRPLWSPDQTALYLSLSTPVPEPQDPNHFISSSRTELLRLSLSDGQLKTLYSPDTASIQSLRFSPDGRQLLLELAGNAGLEDNTVSAGITPPRAIPEDSDLGYGFKLLHFELDTGRRNYFSGKLDLNGSAYWHSNTTLLMRSETYVKPQVWKFWDFQSRSFQPEQGIPDAEGLTLGGTLALSPPPARQLILSLYTPCCTLDNLRTGAYLWDMQQKRLRRIGPDIARLMQDFPGVGLHERPQYDFSQINKDARPIPSSYQYPYPNPSGTVSP